MRPSDVVAVGLVLLLSSATIAPLAAQGFGGVTVPGAPRDGRPLLLGVELGVTVSSFSAEREDGGGAGLDGHRAGLVAGVTAAWRASERVALESGVRWVEKGARGTLQGFEEPVSTDVRLGYLQMPLLLRLTPFPRYPVRASLSAGGAVGFELRCHQDQDPSTVALSVACPADRRNRTDLGLVVGTGLGWTTGPVEVLLDARYEMGLRDVDTTGVLRSRNRSWTLTPRLSIPTGR